MSTTYSTTAGDTFESIARKVYGDEKLAALVSKANPGAREPLAPGTSVTTPPQPSVPRDKPGGAASNAPDEVAVLVDGVRFRFWTDIRITRSIDAMDTAEFSAPFDVDDSDMRAAFRPFAYHPLDVTVGGVPLFTGTLVGVVPSVGNTQRTIGASGYSTPGVLNDCTAPASAYPLEYNNQNLEAIATALCEPFGVTVGFLSEPGAAFERVAASPGKTILSFLIELAQQRNLIVSSDPDGALVFQRSAPAGAPVATLRQGASPVLAVEPFFSPQQYFSHITGLEVVVVGTGGSQYTVKNPHLPGVVRPVTFTAPDALGGDVKAAVDAKAGRMYGAMVAYSVKVDTWRDPAGELWAPNTTIKLRAPGAMVYAEYEFTVRSVTFERSRASETATLNLVVPGSFSGETPEALPWDE